MSHVFFCTRFYDELKEEISSLTELRATTETNNLIVARPQIFCTMIDQKVLNHIMDVSSQCCPICGSTPTEFMDMTNFDTQKFQPYNDGLDFGISPLHAWLNVFNHLLRLADHKPIEQHRACGHENKQMCKLRKQEIQRDLYQEFGIKVGIPNSNGAGNSNNGNCARRAFENPREFARILDLDADLVSDLKAVLVCISSRYPINPLPFKRFCRSIQERYIELYPWYPMSATLHKVLEHSWEVARNFPVPTGLLTEEGLESKHKVHKKIRRVHCRKTSRKDAMHDLFYRSMDLSDPVLAHIAIERSSKYQRFHVIPEQARRFLILNEMEHINEEIPGEFESEDDIHNAAFQAALEGQFNIVQDELDEN